jgi:integrase
MAEKKSDKNYRLAYLKFLKFTTEKYIEIKKIDYAFCEDFKDYLMSLDICEHTVKHYFTCFKGCLNYAVKRGLIASNPAKGIAIRYQQKIVERLMKPELENEYRDLKNGFLFSCYTGLRLSDLMNSQKVRKSHFNPFFIRLYFCVTYQLSISFDIPTNRDFASLPDDSGTILVFASSSDLVNLKYRDIKGNRIKFIQIKTKEQIELQLNETALKIIEQQKSRRKDDYIFHIPSGGKRSKRLKN